LLFADAATGARSPALVRQGQISEIIAAKPQARRRILEDAAGIAGLHARRHEAELRLKAAEDNLLRVEDVLREIDQQVDSLKRQGRQASRYKNISARSGGSRPDLRHRPRRGADSGDGRRAAGQPDLAAVADRTRSRRGRDRAGGGGARDAGPARGGGRRRRGAPAADACPQ
jgi:chromosome segregation protein